MVALENRCLSWLRHLGSRAPGSFVEVGLLSFLGSSDFDNIYIYSYIFIIYTVLSRNLTPIDESTRIESFPKIFAP